MEKAELAEGKITPEALDEWRLRVGTKLRIPNIFNTEAVKDSIRHFADGIGDPNPLWRDEEYAKKTRYGCLVASPAFLYSVFVTYVPQGLSGVHAFHSGNDWKFYKPILLGDTITPECTFIGFDVKVSRFAQKIVRAYQLADYYNQRGELIAQAIEWSVRAERAATRDTGKYAEIKLPHPWTEEELKKVEDDTLAAEARGSNPRFWEDVVEGEELAPIVKGPFGLTDMVAYCIGAAPVPIAAHEVSLKQYRRHPAWAFRDPNTYALEPVYSVHYNKAAANAAGLPYPYDVGAQRQCWLIHLLTNWAGDDGWIKNNYAEYRRFVYHSDAVWLKGKVVKKYVDDDGEHCVDIITSAINQRGENTMPGSAIVVLPSREKNIWPVEKRLKR